MSATHRQLLAPVVALVVLTSASDAAPAPATQPGTNKAVGLAPAEPRRAQKRHSPYRKMHALCIGINDYTSPGIPDLAYAENDAREVSQVLRRVYGFDHVRLLVGKQATRNAIIDGVADLSDRSKVGKEDAALIFFSGHGVTVPTSSGEQGYLLPVDAKVDLKDVRNPAPFRRYAIRMDDLRADADAILARHVLFLIDACYSGFFSVKALHKRADIANALRYPARQVITAGTKNEIAVEHHAWRHGAFTFKLLECLTTEKEPVSASSLGVWLKKTVPQAVATRFPRQHLSPQAKYLSGDGDFYFFRRTYEFDPSAFPATPLRPAQTPPAVQKKVLEAQILLEQLEKRRRAKGEQ